MTRRLKDKAGGGIYRILCLDNLKIYIGSAANFSRRKNGHLVKLRKGVHENRNMQNAFNKYGEDRMLFEIIETVGIESDIIPREQYYIDTLHPEFNVCKVAGATRGLTAWNKGIPTPKSVIAKQQQTKKGRTYERRVVTEEHKKAISIANTGRVKTAEQIRKQSEAVKGRPAWNKGVIGVYISKKRVPVVQMDLRGNEVKVWESIKEAEKSAGRRLNISKCCNEKHRVCNGYKWKYK